MLKKTQSLFVYHLQAAVYSFNVLCRQPLATMMTVVVIAITLALPALFWVSADNLSQLTRDWQHSGSISLYLKPTATPAEQQELLQAVRATQGVANASLKSSTEGLAELVKQEGMHDIMRYLPDNPLPAVIEVSPALTVDSSVKLDGLSKQLATLAQVSEAKLDIEWSNRLHAILHCVGNAADALMFLLCLAVLLIIGNTLRLAIQNRHEEIQILKLIGATDPFILRPFLYSGIWYGLAGVLLAVFLVNLFILSLGVAVNQVAVVYQINYPLSLLSIRQIFSLAVFAIILGWLGAFLAVKKQLASIEPYN